MTRTVDLKERYFVANAPTSLKKSQTYLKCDITTKNSAPKPDATFKREHYFEVLPGRYAIRQHKNTKCFFYQVNNCRSWQNVQRSCSYEPWRGVTFRSIQKLRDQMVFSVPMVRSPWKTLKETFFFHLTLA